MILDGVWSSRGTERSGGLLRPPDSAFGSDAQETFEERSIAAHGNAEVFGDSFAPMCTWW